MAIEAFLNLMTFQPFSQRLSDRSRKVLDGSARFIGLWCTEARQLRDGRLSRRALLSGRDFSGEPLRFSQIAF
jgi:hypothetical protein